MVYDAHDTLPYPRPHHGRWYTDTDDGCMPGLLVLSPLVYQM